MSSALIADEWRASRFEPSSAAAWHRAGFVPIEASNWVGVDIERAEAAAWRAAGVVPGLAREWKLRGFTSETMQTWVRLGFSSAEAIDWAETWEPQMAARWRDAGISRPEMAAVFRSRNIGIGEIAALLKSGIEPTVVRDWARGGWRGENRVMLLEALEMPDKRRAWSRSGVAPADWYLWIPLVRGDAKIAADWRAEGVAFASLDEAARSHELKPDRLREWLAAGYTGRQMINAHKRGERNPKRMQTSAPQPEAPKTPKPFDGYRAWLSEGKEWCASAGMTASVGDPFLELLHDRGLKWASMSYALFEIEPHEDWLPEVLARAESLQSRLRRVPTWPVTFESDDYSIVIDERSGWVRAWVGHGGHGLLVSFNPTTFDVRYREDDADAVFALGIAIGWFLDCSVSLVGGSHPHFGLQGRSTGNSGSGGISYTPQPRFRTAVNSVSSGQHDPPRAHRVEGHIRTLPQDWQPTDEARDRAPAYVRIRMGPRDTFVRPHSRGGEEKAIEMIKRLSSHSSLADFVGLARRGW